MSPIWDDKKAKVILTETLAYFWKIEPLWIARKWW